VATIQPAIVNVFGHVDLVPWLSVAFALASAASTLIWSKAFGLFSAKKLFIGATALFMGASALCGGAPDITAFIVGRALAGVGGTGMYMGLLTILSVNTTEVERPRYLSLTGFWWGIGTVLGPVVGGAFAESSATWRWAFYLNPCVGGVVAPIYFLVLPDYHPMPGVSLRSRLGKLDYIGAALSSGTFLCIMMGMNFGGVLWSWGDGRSIALFVLSGVLFGVFCAQQIFCFMTSTTDRVFPMHFFRNYEMILLFITMSMFCSLLPASARNRETLTYCSVCRIWNIHHHLLPSTVLPVHSWCHRPPDVGPHAAFYCFPLCQRPHQWRLHVQDRLLLSMVPLWLCAASRRWCSAL
jgi:MFS family permease